MKKVYSRPRLTVHGSATGQTKGRIQGDFYDHLDAYRLLRP